MKDFKPDGSYVVPTRECIIGQLCEDLLTKLAKQLDDTSEDSYCTRNDLHKSISRVHQAQGCIDRGLTNMALGLLDERDVIVPGQNAEISTCVEPGLRPDIVASEISRDLGAQRVRYIFDLARFEDMIRAQPEFFDCEEAYNCNVPKTEISYFVARPVDILFEGHRADIWLRASRSELDTPMELFWRYNDLEEDYESGSNEERSITKWSKCAQAEDVKTAVDMAYSVAGYKEDLTNIRDTLELILGKELSIIHKEQAGKMIRNHTASIVINYRCESDDQVVTNGIRL